MAENVYIVFVLFTPGLLRHGNEKEASEYISNFNNISLLSS